MRQSLRRPDRELGNILNTVQALVMELRNATEDKGEIKCLTLLDTQWGNPETFSIVPIGMMITMVISTLRRGKNITPKNLNNAEGSEYG